MPARKKRRAPVLDVETLKRLRLSAWLADLTPEEIKFCRRHDLQTLEIYKREVQIRQRFAERKRSADPTIGANHNTAPPIRR
jgi:hypothetical protein